MPPKNPKSKNNTHASPTPASASRAARSTRLHGANEAAASISPLTKKPRVVGAEPEKKVKSPGHSESSISMLNSQDNLSRNGGRVVIAVLLDDFRRAKELMESLRNGEV